MHRWDETKFGMVRENNLKPGPTWQPKNTKPSPINASQRYAQSGIVLKGDTGGSRVSRPDPEKMIYRPNVGSPLWQLDSLSGRWLTMEV